MLLHEVGRDQADWYLIAKDGTLTVRVSDGLRVGEDSAGLLLLNPTAAEALITFNVDPWGRLQIQPASADYTLISPQRNQCSTYRAEPYQGLGLWLPNNELDLANDLKGITRQYDELPLTLVPNTEREAARAQSGVAQASSEPVLESVVTNPKFVVQDDPIPVLDSPIERIAEPRPTETLITQLPYGFEPKGFTTTEAVPVVPADLESRRGLGKSSRITAIAIVILAGIAAGLLAARLDLIDNPLHAAEQRTAFNPATPRLVLLSETQPDATTTTPEVVSTPEPDAQAAPLTPPETTPATPPVRPVAQPPSQATDASVFRTDLADANELFDKGFITAPAERNTVAILSRILSEDPAHPEATSLLKRCADRMIDAALLAEQHGLEFEARNLVEEVMAFYPGHEQAVALWQRWTDAQGV